MKNRAPFVLSLLALTPLIGCDYTDELAAAQVEINTHEHGDLASADHVHEGTVSQAEFELLLASHEELLGEIQTLQAVVEALGGLPTRMGALEGEVGDAGNGFANSRIDENASGIATNAGGLLGLDGRVSTAESRLPGGAGLLASEGWVQSQGYVDGSSLPGLLQASFLTWNKDVATPNYPVAPTTGQFGDWYPLVLDETDCHVAAFTMELRLNTIGQPNDAIKVRFLAESPTLWANWLDDHATAQTVLREANHSFSTTVWVTNPNPALPMEAWVNLDDVDTAVPPSSQGVGQDATVVYQVGCFDFD